MRCKSSITQKEAMQECRELGFTLKRTGYGDEYVLKDKGKRDDEGYFTDDLDDAVATARRIDEARREQRQDRDLAQSISVGEQS